MSESITTGQPANEADTVHLAASTAGASLGDIASAASLANVVPAPTDAGAAALVKVQQLETQLNTILALLGMTGGSQVKSIVTRVEAVETVVNEVLPPLVDTVKTLQPLAEHVEGPLARLISWAEGAVKGKL